MGHSHLKIYYSVKDSRKMKLAYEDVLLLEKKSNLKKLHSAGEIFDNLKREI